MEDFPGPWKENKAYEDNKDEGDSCTPEVTQEGCSVKILIALFLFMLAATCRGG